MSAVGAPSSVKFTHALRAEWIKLRSLRSTWLTLVCLFVVGIGISLLATSAAGAQYSDATAAERAAWDPTGSSLTSYIVAQLIVGVIGILVVTSEYATGEMQTSVMTSPRRYRLLAAKVVTVTAVAAIAGQSLMFAAFGGGQAVLAAHGAPRATLGDPGVLSAVVGGGVYLTAVALLAVTLGVITRATAGALAILVGIIFVIPGFAGLFPSWVQFLLDYWPTQGAATVMTTMPDADFPYPWLNLGGMCLGVGTLLVAAFVLFRRRDV
ncbi:ABC transporter permease [Isoptericola rhizosphaerae]|uniref:ABC transporter permease n=1 Tax=Isoptericola rhizosphaerae TaxID=3377837 RepID=UPI00383A1A54